MWASKRQGKKSKKSIQATMRVNSNSNQDEKYVFYIGDGENQKVLVGDTAYKPNDPEQTLDEWATDNQSFRITQLFE